MALDTAYPGIVLILSYTVYSFMLKRFMSSKDKDSDAIIFIFAAVMALFTATSSKTGLEGLLVMGYLFFLFSIYSKMSQQGGGVNDEYKYIKKFLTLTATFVLVDTMFALIMPTFAPFLKLKQGFKPPMVSGRDLSAIFQRAILGVVVAMVWGYGSSNLNFFMSAAERNIQNKFKADPDGKFWNLKKITFVVLALLAFGIWAVPWVSVGSAIGGAATLSNFFIALAGIVGTYAGAGSLGLGAYLGYHKLKKMQIGEFFAKLWKKKIPEKLEKETEDITQNFNDRLGKLRDLKTKTNRNKSLIEELEELFKPEPLFKKFSVQVKRVEGDKDFIKSKVT